MKVDTLDFRTVFNLEKTGPQRDIPTPIQYSTPIVHISNKNEEESHEDHQSPILQHSTPSVSIEETKEDEEEKEQDETNEESENVKEEEEDHNELQNEKEIKEKQQEIKIRNYEPSHSEYPKQLPTSVCIHLPTKRTQIIPADLSIYSLIPRDLPARCYATIGINASGDSESANFAIKRLRTDDPIIYCDEIHIRDSILYLLILRNDLLFHESPLGALIDCEEKSSIESLSKETKIFKFNYNTTTSPYFNFDSILRSAIKAAIREIIPFDLTELFINGSVSYMSSYQFSAYKKAFCDLILSSYFLKYLVPFDHKLLGYNELKGFVSSVQTADRKLENLGIQQFLVPLDKNFNSADFYSKITIFAEEEVIETSFDDILLEFLEDL